MTTIAVMQPTFLPWLGYFDLMDGVDTLVLLDDVQLSYQSWHHRNRVRTAAGLSWLTVPVRRADRFGRLDEIAIGASAAFPDALMNRFVEAYRGAPHVDRALEVLAPLAASHPGANLVDLDLALIERLREILEVTTSMLRSSHLTTRGLRGARLVALCTELGADTYVTPPGALAYLVDDAHLFAEAGIGVQVHEYAHPEYPQCFEPFLSHASAIDAVANLGHGAAAALREGRRAWSPLPPTPRGA